MARDDDDGFDPRTLDEDALMQQLGGTKAPSDLPASGSPTSNTMPVPFGPDNTGVRSPTKPAGPNASPYSGFQAKHDFSAFDTAREQDPGKSAKDAFAMLANQAPPPPLSDKAALGQWFNQYILPGMNQLGHGAQEATGDTFGFKNWQGNFNVDFGQNAGGEGGRLQWGADSADDATAAMYAPGGSAPAYTPTQAPAGMPTSQTGESPIDAILAEVEALQNGGQSPMDAQALMALLQQGGVA